jgi:DNA-binding response OmpR family regulator
MVVLPERVVYFMEASMSISAGTARSVDARVLLVVDDDRDTLDVLPIVLAHPQVRIVTATDGTRAIEAARALQPDCVLIDVRLPGVAGNGLDVLAQIRSECAKSVAAVIMTAGPTPAMRARAVAIGARWIEKPFEIDEIRYAVLKALGVEEVSSHAKRK